MVIRYWGTPPSLELPRGVPIPDVIISLFPVKEMELLMM